MIIEKSNHYQIPLKDFTILGLEFEKSPFLGILIKKENEIYLIDINEEFELTLYNKASKQSPKSKDTWKKIIELIDKKITDFRGNKDGSLFIELTDNCSISVPDSEYESWILNKIVGRRSFNSWVIGGVGSINYFE